MYKKERGDVRDMAFCTKFWGSYPPSWQYVDSLSAVSVLNLLCAPESFLVQMLIMIDMKHYIVSFLNKKRHFIE